MKLLYMYTIDKRAIMLFVQWKGSGDITITFMKSYIVANLLFGVFITQFVLGNVSEVVLAVFFLKIIKHKC